MAAAEDRIVTLTERQFGVLDMLHAQRRAVILGVAGSGKTLIAAEKARRLAAEGFDVLLTCFNRPLAEWLAATVGRHERVTVSTFHRLAERLGQEAGLIGAKPAHDAAYFDGLADILDRVLRDGGGPRFDAIVVDEGQDLDSVWWLPLLDLLRDRERGIVYVFGDANQDLYHAREPDELGVVMPERTDPFYLHENRRSTKAIHDFAQRFSQTDASAPPSVSLGPDGSPVEIVTYADDDPEACRKAVAGVLREIIDRGRWRGGLRGADAAIGPFVVAHVGRWSPVEAWPYRLMPEYGPEGAVLPPPTKGDEVRVATIHRYKGLESPCVVLAEIDGRVEPGDLASLLYVGATRARSHLVVVCSESVKGIVAPDVPVKCRGRCQPAGPSANEQWLSVWRLLATGTAATQRRVGGR